MKIFTIKTLLFNYHIETCYFKPGICDKANNFMSLEWKNIKIKGRHLLCVMECEHEGETYTYMCLCVCNNFANNNSLYRSGCADCVESYGIFEGLMCCSTLGSKILK